MWSRSCRPRRGRSLASITAAGADASSGIVRRGEPGGERFGAEVEHEVLDVLGSLLLHAGGEPSLLLRAQRSCEPSLELADEQLELALEEAFEETLRSTLSDVRTGKITLVFVVLQHERPQNL